MSPDFFVTYLPDRSTCNLRNIPPRQETVYMKPLREFLKRDAGTEAVSDKLRRYDICRENRIRNTYDAPNFGDFRKVEVISERSGRILWIGRIHPSDLPVPLPGKHLDQPLQDEDFCEVRANYSPVLLSIDWLCGLLSDERINPSAVISDEAALLICLLACAFSLINQDAAEYQSLATDGYLAYESDRFHEILRSAFAELPSNIREIAGYAEPPVLRFRAREDSVYEWKRMATDPGAHPSLRRIGRPCGSSGGK